MAKDATGGYAAKIRELGNPGVVPRNAANRLCFANAAVVLEQGLDPKMLFWPNAASPSAGPSTPTSPAGALSVDAQQAKAEAQAALDHFVAVEWEHFISEGPSAGRDLRDWEEPHHEAEPEPSPNLA